MAKRQGLILLFLAECLALVLGVGGPALAVWPPSTAFQEEGTSALYGFIVIAFVIGIVIGIWAQRNHHEHK